MAGNLNLLAAIVSALALAAVAAPDDGRGAAPGAPLADPTRPPAHLGHAGPAVTSAAAGPVLQSVLISAERRSAIISGERVELGGKFGEARLTGLTEAEAVLEGPQGRTVLKLLPRIEKRAAGSPRQTP